MINKVILVGNVGQDPEVRYTGDATNGAKVASLRLATTERYRDRNGNLQEHTEWHSIVAWRNTADVIEKYVRKGTQLYIEGRLRTRSWDDQNGNKRDTTEIMADTLQLLGRKSDNPASMNPAAPQAAPQQYAPQQQTYSAPQQPQYSQPQPAAKPQNIVEDLPDDDLPF